MSDVSTMTEDEILEAIKSEVAANRVFLYMKGTPDAPACGFSMRVVQILELVGVEYGSRNILEDPRVRMVLGTRPGQLPWRPTFGCDLDRFVGMPLTASRLDDMATLVRDAIERHMPEVDIIECGVRVETRWGAPSDAERRSGPIGEAALGPVS